MVAVAIQRLLCAKYGNFCAYPDCTQGLIVKRGSEERFFGEIAHIISSQPNGPRYDPTFDPELIDTELNLLVMCERHHREIDTFVEQWPVEKLRQLRRNVLATTATEWKPWLPRLQSINYANPIRLAHLALLRGVRTSLPRDAPNRTQGLNVVVWVEAVLQGLAGLDVEARRLTMDLDLRTLRAGDLLVFDRQLRTLHGPAVGDTNSPLTGDLDVDPLVYFSRGGIRVVMPIDPECITTTTAFHEFNQGSIRQAGLCQIKRRIPPGHPPSTKKRPRGQFIASPLLLGIGAYPPDDDLGRRKVFQAWDPETDDEMWVGPWTKIDQSDDGSG